MSAKHDVLDAIEAAQADRRTAHEAGQAAAAQALFDRVVSPLNALLARIVLHPPADAEIRREALAILDAGLAALAGTLPETGMARTRAAAGSLRGTTDGGAAPRPSVNPTIPDRPPAPALDSPAPVPHGPAGRFVSARRTVHMVVAYVDAEGREVLRQGGSRSWRNNNPGNIRRGNFADMHGAIGDDGAFAIFPDEATGFEAIVALLRTPTYGALSLKGAIERYAPPSENDSGRYLRFVTEATGLDPATVLGTMKIAEIRAIARAIQQMEGWTPGAERPDAPLSGQPAGEGVPAGVSSAIGAAQEWMALAEAEAALPARARSAWADPEENPRILEYFRVAAPWFERLGGDSDETDWCAAFVNWCLVTSGHIGTNHPGARSFFWNRKGQFIRLDGPRKGCIAVRRYAPFDDPAWENGPGHVGFVSAFTDTHLTLLGGNQSDTVCHQVYPRKSHDAQGRLASEFVAFLMPVMT